VSDLLEQHLGTAFVAPDGIAKLLKEANKIKNPLISKGYYLLK